MFIYKKMYQKAWQISSASYFNGAKKQFCLVLCNLSYFSLLLYWNETSLCHLYLHFHCRHPQVINIVCFSDFSNQLKSKFCMSKPTFFILRRGIFSKATSLDTDSKKHLTKKPDSLVQKTFYCADYNVLL